MQVAQVLEPGKDDYLAQMQSLMVDSQVTKFTNELRWMKMLNLIKKMYKLGQEGM